MEINPADSHFSATALSDHVLSIFFDNSSCPARNRYSMNVNKIKSHLQSAGRQVIGMVKKIGK